MGPGTSSSARRVVAQNFGCPRPTNCGEGRAAARRFQREIRRAWFDLRTSVSGWDSTQKRFAVFAQRAGEERRMALENYSDFKAASQPVPGKRSMNFSARHPLPNTVLALIPSARSVRVGLIRRNPAAAGWRGRIRLAKAPHIALELEWL